MKADVKYRLVIDMNRSRESNGCTQGCPLNPEPRSKIKSVASCRDEWTSLGSPTDILERALSRAYATVYIECNQKEIPQGDHDIRQSLRKVCY